MNGSHIKKKPMRNSAMEALGFIERPSVSYVRPPQVAPSRLVSTSTRSGLTVAEMWETTELEADSMADWKPDAVDERRLNKRIRWPMLVLWALILGALGTGAYLVWQAPANGAQAALAGVAADADVLVDTLGPLEDVTNSLIPGQNVDSVAISAAASAVDDASRRLFTSSGDLPASEASSRSAATEAATQALEASKNLTGLAAYVGAVTQVIVVPTLITNPALVDLETAVRDFGEWRNQFDTVRRALPEGTLTTVTDELASVSARLESLQNAYIDGLRDDDAVAALAAVRDLEGLMATAWTKLLDETDALKEDIASKIGLARASLDLLPG
ncbi:MAG: hypothetical protein OEM39_05580 [Acidimicrobiia bacterium]|nr:hypothetical protein [Acidimicrobiia bacterium]MDH3462746.1 hypothetical protein [Acidimicrobiia bacterium]